MRTCIVDSAPARTGTCRVARFWGQGVRAGDIPASGVHGAPLLRNDVSLPEDAELEVRAEILAHTFPAGTVDVDDFGGLGTTGAPNGLHYLLYRLWVDGLPSFDDIGFGPGAARAVIAIGQDHTPAVPAPAFMRPSGLRVAVAGRATAANWPPLDLAETDDLVFDFGAAITAPAMRSLPPTGQGDVLASVQVTVEPREGTDAAAAAVLVGAPHVGSSFALQRVRAGAPGVRYLLRAVGTFAPSGRTATAIAFLQVRRLA